MAARRPSDRWNGWDGLAPESNLRERIHALLSSANLKELEKRALKARIARDKTLETTLSCTIDPARFASGFNNVVMEVAFSDEVYWIAKIQHAPLGAPDENTTDLLSEIATMRTVNSRTEIPVPEIFAFDVSPLNGVGYPYILMEYLNGRVLDGPIASTVPPESLPKVARQIAQVLFQLWDKLAFDRLGRLWCGDDGAGPPEIIPFDKRSPPPQTSLEWFYARRQDENRRALEPHADDPQWITACSVLKSALPSIVVEDRVHGPFPLCHVDLHYGNLIFDDEYNLKGVLDWSQAQTVPLERLVVSPEFITFPAGSAEVNKPILTFRSLIRQHLQHLEESDPKISASGSTPTLPSHIFGTRRADITHRCTYSLPHRALWDGMLVARLLYGESITWEQLVSVHGEKRLSSSGLECA